MATYTRKPEGLESQSDDHVDVEEVDRAVAPPVTLQSFAHLNEKAILRKVRPCPAVIASLPTLTPCQQMDMRLIPMLALLYLLSFLDRASPLFQLLPKTT